MTNTYKFTTVLAPKLPQEEGFVGPTSVIYFPEQTSLDSTKTQYKLMVNRSFFDDVSNGALQERGVIVMGADEGMLKSFCSDESKLNVTFSSTIINLHYLVIMAHQQLLLSWF